MRELVIHLAFTKRAASIMYFDIMCFYFPPNDIGTGGIQFEVHSGNHFLSAHFNRRTNECLDWFPCHRSHSIQPEVSDKMRSLHSLYLF